MHTITVVSADESWRLTIAIDRNDTCAAVIKQVCRKRKDIEDSSACWLVVSDPLEGKHRLSEDTILYEIVKVSKSISSTSNKAKTLRCFRIHHCRLFLTRPVSSWKTTTATRRTGCSKKGVSRDSTTKHEEIPCRKTMIVMLIATGKGGQLPTHFGALVTCSFVS